MRRDAPRCEARWTLALDLNTDGSLSGQGVFGDDATPVSNLRSCRQVSPLRQKKTRSSRFQQSNFGKKLSGTMSSG
jgi:hypothetical protein